MKSVQNLPQGYKELYKLDLKQNKEMIIVNVLSVTILIVMMLVMNFFVPINTLFLKGESTQNLILKLIVIAISMFVYIVLHEAVHGIAMKIFGASKVNFGFKGLYAFAGSKDYYCKGAYITIALAPVIVWTIVLAVINAFVPENYFWVVYIVQMINVSGASGDIYVSCKFAKLKKDVLIQDTGTEMIVYEK